MNSIFFFSSLSLSFYIYIYISLYIDNTHNINKDRFTSRLDWFPGA